MEKVINRKKTFIDIEMLWLQVCVIRGRSQMNERVVDVITVCPSGGISSKNTGYYTSHNAAGAIKKKHLNGDENSDLAMISKQIR